jgi:hypothetical protein
MPCFYPIRVYSFKHPETGKSVINFNIPKGKDPNLSLPCNKCIGCKLEYSRQWAVRCTHESMLHSENCFITLTYDDIHLPRLPLATLVPEHLCKFFKKLRMRIWRQYGLRVRHYSCGEYGEVSGRPHYHSLLFGFRPRDGIRIKPDLFYSEWLSDVWQYGNCSFGDVTFESACYVTGYVAKKVGRCADDYLSIDEFTGEVFQIHPEFCRMSRGDGKDDPVFSGGIGHGFYSKYSDDMYRNDLVVLGSRQSGKPPRFYDKHLELDNPELYSRIKDTRDINRADDTHGTDARLRAREACALAKVKRKGDRI